MGPNDQSIEDILASIRKVIVDEPAVAAPAPLAAADAPLHQPAAADDDVLELSRPLPPLAAEPTPRAGLVAPETADASRLALAALSQLRLTGSDPADDTLAGLVRELLKPMLKAWLDAELPAIVERMVVQEIARITVSPLPTSREREGPA